MYRVNEDLTLTGIRSGMSKGARVAYWRDGSRTWYANGVENGYVENASSHPWPNQSEHIGQDTSRKFSPAPVGTLVAVAFGRMWIVQGDAVFYSEPYLYGKFDLARNYFQLPRPIRLLLPLASGQGGGIWLSDEVSTWFVAGSDPAQMAPIRVADFPALEGSAACSLYERITDDGMVAMFGAWGCPHGACIGDAGGGLRVIARKKLILPKGMKSGATLIRGGSNIITHMRG
jgi:hypothetical protein